MAGSFASLSPGPRAARLADAMAARMAGTAHVLRTRGDHEAAESLLALARQNRIAALKLRVEQGVARGWSPV
jgi:hypothetical protein